MKIVNLPFCLSVLLFLASCDESGFDGKYEELKKTGAGLFNVKIGDLYATGGASNSSRMSISYNSAGA